MTCEHKTLVITQKMETRKVPISHFQRRERDNFEPITTVFEESGNIIILLGNPLNKQLSVGLIKIKIL